MRHVIPISALAAALVVATLGSAPAAPKQPRCETKYLVIAQPPGCRPTVVETKKAGAAKKAKKSKPTEN